MNEVTHIHLGRTPFTIAADAHHALRVYLHDIEAQTGKNKEVMEEVELRMAELLAERGIGGEKVVLLADVDFLKEQLGEPSDFTDDDADAPHHAHAHQNGKSKTGDAASAEAAPRQLFRDTDNGLFAGVAAGLGAYFNVDPLIFRLLFIVLTFASGLGIIAYLIMWWIVPPVKTESDRLKLNGKPITVDTIRESVTGAVERADIPAVARRMAGTTERLAHFVARAVLGIIGLVLLTLGACTLLGASAAALYALVRGYAIGGIHLFPIGTEERLAVISGFAVLAVVCILWMFAGVAMMRRKQGLPGWALASLIAIFVAAGAGAAVTITDSVQPVRDRYQSAQHTDQRTLPKYTTADIELGNVNYFIVAEAPGAQPEYRLDVQTLGNISTKDITSVVTNGKLVVRANGLAHTRSCNLVCPYGDTNVRVVIYQPAGVGMTINGSYNPADQTQSTTNSDSPVAPVTPATPVSPKTPVAPHVVTD